MLAPSGGGGDHDRMILQAIRYAIGRQHRREAAALADGHHLADLGFQLGRERGPVVPIDVGRVDRHSGALLQDGSLHLLPQILAGEVMRPDRMSHQIFGGFVHLAKLAKQNAAGNRRDNGNWKISGFAHLSDFRSGGNQPVP